MPGRFLRGKRFPIMDYAFSKGVTMRDDSILVSKAPEQWYHDEMAQLFWPAMPVVLEHEHYGLSKKRGNWDSELLVESVEAYHASYMSIHWWPREGVGRMPGRRSTGSTAASATGSGWTMLPGRKKWRSEKRSQ